MDDEEQILNGIVASQGSLSIDSIESLEDLFKSEPDDTLTASSSAQWGEVQQARAEYLREWEEDMRFAQELASEGM
jgi:hypothetical protein